MHIVVLNSVSVHARLDIRSNLAAYDVCVDLHEKVNPRCLLIMTMCARCAKSVFRTDVLPCVSYHAFVQNDF